MIHNLIIFLLSLFVFCTYKVSRIAHIALCQHPCFLQSTFCTNILQLFWKSHEKFNFYYIYESVLEFCIVPQNFKRSLFTFTKKEWVIIGPSKYVANDKRIGSLLSKITINFIGVKKFLPFTYTWWNVWICAVPPYSTIVVYLANTMNYFGISFFVILITHIIIYGLLHPIVKSVENIAFIIIHLDYFAVAQNKIFAISPIWIWYSVSSSSLKRRS